VNSWQACKRIKSILKSLRWGGSGDPVFGRDSVYITVANVESFSDQLPFPVAFVRPGSGRSDEDRPGLTRQDIAVFILTAVPGDMIGERPLMGGNRISKTGNGGRGILEIEAEVLSSVELLNASDQFRISLQSTSRVGVKYDEDSGYHAWREYAFGADLTTAYQHQEPRVLTTSEAGGTVTVSWSVPDDVTNLTGYIVRRTTGTIPVGFPTSGTSVPWTSGTSTTDAPGAGTYTYSVFAAYDDEGGSLLINISDYVAQTQVVA
jgi:hypothetical protein